MLTRRAILCASALVGLAGPARAQLLSKTVRIIVGFPVGGATDILARILAGVLRGTYAASVIAPHVNFRDRRWRKSSSRASKNCIR